MAWNGSFRLWYVTHLLFFGYHFGFVYIATNVFINHEPRDGCYSFTL